MESQHKVFESPAWAGRLLSALALLAFVLLMAMALPAWRQSLGPFVGVSFGLFWGLFGLFTFAYDWAIPLRGGGFVSPHQNRWLWLLFCLGTLLIGCCCLAFSYRQLGVGPQHGG
ncbi:hypothetical protein [Geothrix oryzae]|uniref:hypothetical protein n=1 Tax=Geothrix oryzae TaxID=2927975 RepID=UPI00257223C6|nr:hypothetical protein [Geothrix oryzae]